MNEPDRRLNAFRQDLAATYLKGQVAAPRFVEGEPATVCAPSVLLWRAPADDSVIDSELLFGENVRVYDRQAGWAWVQNESDSYVGYVPAASVRVGRARATHRIAVPRSPLFATPSIKCADRGLLSLNAPLHVAEMDGDFAKLADDAGYVFAAHIMPADDYHDDFVGVAAQFLHAPYRWGGRTSLGLDCSALVQMALAAVGIAAPRDSDLQERYVGDFLAVEEDHASLRRGDLMFWKGHVGIVAAPGMLLHATGHFMQVVEEPVAQAVARIAGQGLPVTAIKRIGVQ